ncbi:MAG TPA: acetate--CoA ligase family protein, partial [Longimicrobiaceae bacterium]
MSALRPSPADFADDLRVRGARALRGPNAWRPTPVVACEVELGRLAPSTSADAEGFAERLLAALPGLRGRSGGELEQGAPWPRVLEHVALELQTLAGCAVSFSASAHQDGDVWMLAVDYEEEEPGVESVYEAGALVRRALRGEDPETGRVVAMLREVYRASRPGPTAMVMMEEARRRGIPVRRFPGDSVVQLGLGRGLRRLDATMTDLTSVIATDITSDKARTKRVLERAGLPVPEGGVADTPEEALEIAADLGFPVLVKPLDANDGRGVSGRLDDPDAVRAAWPVAAAEHPKVVVERYVEGRDHRVLVVDGRVVAVA